MLYEEPSLTTSYVVQGQYLILKCEDQFEYLCEQTICMIKAVHDPFPNVQGVLNAMMVVFDTWIRRSIDR